MRLLRVLDRSRFQPIVYFPEGGSAVDALTAAGESCRVVPMMALERTLRRVPGYVRDLLGVTRALRRQLRDDAVGLVHINTSMTPHAGLAARLLRLPVIWHVRECVRPDAVNNLYVRGMVGLAHRLVAVSAAVRGHLEARAPGAADKTDVIHNGIDLLWFEAQAASGCSRSELGLPDAGRLVVIPAGLLAHKGHEDLIEATRMLVHEKGVRDVTLLIAGDEPPEEGGRFTRRLHEMTRDCQLLDHVAFLGFRKDLPAVLAASNVVCLPSTCEDSFPNGVLEGMAAGKPVVATRTGGIPEMVEHGRTGLLVERSSPAQLAEALATVLGDASKARSMGDAGRRRLQDNFSAALHVAQIQELYTHVLEAARP
jgi:glycosyltransferase involved in cell wall biosynthesis